jgi:hypothetical protein
MQVFNLKNGPLPLSARIDTNIVGGRLRIFVSGTTRLTRASPAEETIVGVIVRIDGEEAGKAQMWLDDASVRHFFANQFEVASPKIGQHEISLEPFKETPSTEWDLYSLAVAEFLDE